ncbi:MAG: nuclear transport factor 2 family protein [Candidatus Pseudobacter hemicellulosilyticus]|uniref:Nuclear transport factor 2 family protein n=1 Tax=Candidatus Pseudobacter hemicellulosilyticus TaxID=3121375 RepID=A0AAJ6BG97_9BACT|nr:MAG: nuclear transport factor 2 family protein [Pseudobacter sp.]
MYTKMLALCFTTFLLSTTLLAQSKDEQAVAAAVEALRKAMLDGNRGALDSLAAPELTYGHSSGKMEDKHSFVETIASGQSDFVTLELSDQSITVIGNTALVRHKLNATTNDGGKPGTVSLGILLVWQKQHKHWKLIARQAFKSPTNN